MEIKQCVASELTSEERRKCARLSFRGDGDLQLWLRRWPEAHVVTVWRDSVLLGWGMRLPTGSTGYYVRATERRQGIGTLIFYTLNPPRTSPRVYPHDEKSAAFFYSLRQMDKRNLTYYTGGKSPKELGIKRKSRREAMEKITV